MAVLENPTKAEPTRRRASKEFRRDQLIQATIDSLAKRGFSATTMADVADGASLSRGIVNFHFESKDKLFVETLTYLSDEYAANWHAQLEKVEQTPAKRLRALVLADLDKKICTPRNVAAWFSVMTEAKGKPALQKLGWSRDEDYIAALEAEIEQIRLQGGYAFDTSKTASALYAMQEGLWFRMMLNRKEFNRDAAVEISLTTLGSLFAHHFDANGTPLKDQNK